MGERRGVYSAFVMTTGGKRPHGRLRHRWDDNDEMNFQQVEWRNMDWIDLAQKSDRWRALVNAVMNARVP
jgi:hypothetical protein